MSDTSSLTRIWFIDWYGCIIDHDPIRDELIRRGFTSGEYPDLFLLAPVPMKLPMSAVLRKRSSLPRTLPELELVDASDGLVALYAKDRDAYFSINPRNELTNFAAQSIMGWERFVPLTLEMLNGVSNLVDPARATVVDSSGKTCTMNFDGENMYSLGNFNFAITTNADTLTTIGNLEAGKELKFTLKGTEGSSTADFTVTRLAG